jgi:exopolysaccharide production protein ExoZ
MGLHAATSSTNLLPTRKDVAGVQYLRGIAAMMVVIHHAHEQFPATLALLPTAAFQGGVDIFFAISGFIMMYTTANHPMTGGSFLLKRFVRIAPLYWTMTLLVALAAMIAPRFFHDTVFTWPELITSLAFWPLRNPAHSATIGPLIKLGWTLNYEMFFYFVFAGLILLPPLRRLSAIAVIFSLIVALGWFLNPAAVPLRFWSHPIILEFVGGCLLGVLEARGTLGRLSPLIAFAVLVLSSVAFFYFGAGALWNFDRVIFRGLPALGITFSVVALDREQALRIPGRLGAMLLLLGDASYSIYLSHLYAVRGFSNAWEKLHLPISSMLAATVYVLLCVSFGALVGIMVWKYLELPATEWTRRIFMRRRLAPA